MTEEEQIEEILMEANAWGLRHEVIELAAKYLQQNPYMNRVSAYELAYQEWVK